MKQIGLLFGVALLSSILSITILKLVEEPEKIVIKETIPTRLVNQYNAAPNSTYSPNRLAGFGTKGGFTVAASAVTPAVVNIRSFSGGNFDFWSSNYGGASGSGVLISPDGYIVTNNHVIEDGTKIEVTLFDEREYRARVVGTDPSTDLALLKLTAEEPLPFVPFGNSDSVLVGEWALAVGNPFNLESTVTAGIVSAKGRNIDILEGEYKIESFIQTDAAVNPGNSGGALVNVAGELIGVNTAIITRSGRYEGYSFAIPANLVQKVVHDLKEYGNVQRAILGVIIRDITSDKAKELGLNKPTGVLIQSINQNSAAEDAGLKNGDVILSINGKKVSSVPELQEVVAQFRPGNRVSVEFWRKKTKEKVEVVLKDLENKYTSDPPATQDFGILNDLGFELRDLSSQELERVPVKRGVIVNSIFKGSVIDETNMDPGFIITEVNEVAVGSGDSVRKINQFKVNSVEDVVKALQEIENGIVLLEGVYENYSDEWGYTFNLD